jgi:hypothetical protein
MKKKKGKEERNEAEMKSSRSGTERGKQIEKSKWKDEKKKEIEIALGRNEG